jgi:hypothetical protein
MIRARIGDQKSTVELTLAVPVNRTTKLGRKCVGGCLIGKKPPHEVSTVGGPSSRAVVGEAASGMPAVNFIEFAPKAIWVRWYLDD